MFLTIRPNSCSFHMNVLKNNNILLIQNILMFMLNIFIYF
jgi:hypothetical protein